MKQVSAEGRTVNLWALNHKKHVKDGIFVQLNRIQRKYNLVMQQDCDLVEIAKFSPIFQPVCIN